MILSEHSVFVKDNPVNVIEGSYSQRDHLRKYSDISAVIDIDPQLQLERLAKRNPQKLQMFIDRWIPLEEMYFQTYRIYERADIVLQAGNE
jgi:dephospho-CoA kinase